MKFLNNEEELKHHAYPQRIREQVTVEDYSVYLTISNVNVIRWHYQLDCGVNHSISDKLTGVIQQIRAIWFKLPDVLVNLHF